MNENYDRYIVKQKNIGDSFSESYICCTATINDADRITNFYNKRYSPMKFYYYKNNKYVDDYIESLDNLIVESDNIENRFSDGKGLIQHLLENDPASTTIDEFDDDFKQLVEDAVNDLLRKDNT